MRRTRTRAETRVIRDAQHAALDLRRNEYDGELLAGFGIAELTDGDGALLQAVPFCNLLTDVGDEYFAKRAGQVAVNVPTGMRLGTGSTAVAKNGAGAAIVTYTSGSSVAIDGGFPTAATKGAGAGWRVTHKTTWAAGVATATGLNEVVITNETALTNVTGSAANTLSRALLSPVVNKGASDTLAVTWLWDCLGS